MARKSWLDDAAETTLIDDYARNLNTFLEAMADGVIEAHELADQEARVVALMKDVEPRLDDTIHAKVTQLLCEMSALSIMQVLHSLYEARPKSKFVG